MLLEKPTKMNQMFHFNPKADLLLKLYEIDCNLFVQGLITYDQFVILENDYFKRKKLFTVNLN